MEINQKELVEQDVLLREAVAPVFEDWKYLDRWNVFKFNFNGASAPRMREVSVLDDAVVAFDNISNLILYLISDASSADRRTIRIEDPILIVGLSTINSAHSMSELMSFLSFVKEIDVNIKIGINFVIVKYLPFLYQLLVLFIDRDRIVLLEEGRTYSLKKAWLRRETHFNSVLNWNDVAYSRGGDMLSFADLASLLVFVDDPASIRHKVAQIYAEHHKGFQLHDRIMLIKTVDDRLTTTPGRAMTLSSKSRQRIESAGIKIISIDQFGSIEEYICTLYHAQVFITSYGGAACTNRFFLNADCDVLLLANRNYKWEYDYVVQSGEYWHVRHSHLFPVKRQRVLLDHNDDFTAADIERVVMLCADR